MGAIRDIRIPSIYVLGATLEKAVRTALDAATVMSSALVEYC